MRSVSAIIVINLAYVSCMGWNTFFPRNEFNHDVISYDPVIYPNLTRHSLRQPLDHFDPNENRTFKVWYEQSLDFWKPNGPIYMWISNYFPEESGAPQGFEISNSTLTYALAQETNGAMFISEIRYYGESYPPHVHKSDDDYFKYLNTTQQLADIAELIKYLKSKPEFQSSKVVLLGWDHEANLATWMRLVYPELVDAAVACSAPLLAKKESREIMEHVANLYNQYGYEGCLNDIEERFQWFRESLKNATELEFFKIKHTICKEDNFTVMVDQQNYMVLQHALYKEFTWDGFFGGIKKCDRYRIDGIGVCFDFSYDLGIKRAKQSKLPLDYQTCLEYGQFPTVAAKRQQPFDDLVTLDFFLKYCKDVYDIDEKRMDEGIAQTNLMYGGLTPNVTNVIFTQGELNPYKFLGVQQNLSDSAPAFVLKKEGHQNIIYMEGNDENRLEIINSVKTLIKQWIGL